MINTEENKKRNAIWIGIGISLLWLIIGIFTLPDYGPVIDTDIHLSNALSHMDFFKGGKLAVENIYNIRYYGPFADIISGAFVQVFSISFHLLKPLYAFNLPILLFAAGIIFIVFLWLYETAGTKAAVFGSLFLALTPAFIGHGHVNMKDIPIAFFFLAALYAGYQGIEKKSWKLMIISAILTGCALATRITAMLIPAILFLWILFFHRKAFSRKEILLYPFIALFFMILLWPWMWSSPIAHLSETIIFYKNSIDTIPTLYFGEVYSGAEVPWHYAVVNLFFALPPLVLLFFIFFISKFFLNFKNIKEKIREKKACASVYSLLIIWIVITLISESLPSITIYNTIRHFLHILIPVSMLAGLGGAWLWEYLEKKKIHALLRYGFFIFSFSFLLLTNIQLHPYEMSYFNIFAGGINGAYQNFEQDYWALSYKEASGWLNANAEENSTVYTPHGPNLLSSQLRKDLQIGKEPEAQYTVYLMNNLLVYKEPLPKGTPAYIAGRGKAVFALVYKK